MNRRFVMISTLAATLVLTSAPAALAAPSSFSPALHAMFSRQKMVRLDLRNDSGAPIEVRVGENVVTLASGKTQSFKLAPGTRITAESTTKTYAAGTLLAQASTTLDGATIVLH